MTDKHAHGVFEESALNERDQDACPKTEEPRRTASTDRSTERRLRRRTQRDATGRDAVSADGCSGRARALPLAAGLGVRRAGGTTGAKSEAVAVSQRNSLELRPERAGRAGPREHRHDDRDAAGDHVGIRGREHLCARQRLHRKTQCRYRRSRQGRRPVGADHRSRTRLSDIAEPRRRCIQDAGDLAAERGQQRARRSDQRSRSAIWSGRDGLTAQ